MYLLVYTVGHGQNALQNHFYVMTATYITGHFEAIIISATSMPKKARRDVGRDGVTKQLTTYCLPFTVHGLPFVGLNELTLCAMSQTIYMVCDVHVEKLDAREGCQTNLALKARLVKSGEVV
jgi:hypothetical protein